MKGGALLNGQGDLHEKEDAGVSRTNFIFDLNPPPMVKDPERFYRSGEKTAVVIQNSMCQKTRWIAPGLHYVPGSSPE
jgi:hypothetical protein